MRMLQNASCFQTCLLSWTYLIYIYSYHVYNHLNSILANHLLLRARTCIYLNLNHRRYRLPAMLPRYSRGKSLHPRFCVITICQPAHRISDYAIPFLDDCIATTQWMLVEYLTIRKRTIDILGKSRPTICRIYWSRFRWNGLLDSRS